MIKTNVTKSITVKIFKRSMHRVTARFVRTPTNLIESYISHTIRHAVTTVHRASPQTMSHEESQNNVICTTTTKKPLIHPSVATTTCGKTGCELRSDCENVCEDSEKKTVTILQLTHDGYFLKVKRISSKDLNGNPREQFATIFDSKNRTETSQPEKTKDDKMTEQLRQDKEAMTNIHIFKRMYDDK